MTKTVVSHFFNEEYMLPWWLEHHKKMFDHGIMIDYHSTDESVNIIKSICPDWEIIPSRNHEFGARTADAEVEDIERNITGWRVCLNVTEFLVGNMSTLDLGKPSYMIPCMFMVDNQPDTYPDQNIPLVQQKQYGIHYHDGFRLRRARLIHQDSSISYPLGRHYEEYDNEDFLILWYGWSPYNDSIRNRKLQIQQKIPESDKMRGFGSQHLMNANTLEETYRNYLSMARDLSGEIKGYL